MRQSLMPPDPVGVFFAQTPRRTYSATLILAGYAIPGVSATTGLDFTSVLAFIFAFCTSLQSLSTVCPFFAHFLPGLCPLFVHSSSTLSFVFFPFFLRLCPWRIGTKSRFYRAYAPQHAHPLAARRVSSLVLQTFAGILF
jgi:hypothetical protein